MSLSIDRLDITLPASLGARKHAIHRLLRRELAILDWPEGRWASLQAPTLGVRANATNLGVARDLARQLHASAWHRARGLESTRAATTQTTDTGVTRPANPGGES